MPFQRRRLPGRPFGMTTVNFCLEAPEDEVEEEAKGIELGAEDLRSLKRALWMDVKSGRPRDSRSSS